MAYSLFCHSIDLKKYVSFMGWLNVADIHVDSDD